MKITIVNNSSVVDVPGGTSLAELCAQLEPVLGFKTYCAHVNNKTESLSYRLFGPKTVEFLSKETPSGTRVYIRSVSMLLYKAVADLYPGTRLRIEHSTHHGYFCRLFGGQEVNAHTVNSLEKRMRELVKEDIPFVRHEDLTSNVLEIFRKQGLNDKVRLLETTDSLYTVYYSLGDLCDSYYSSLVPSTGYLDTFSLCPYKGGFIMSLDDCDNVKGLPKDDATAQEKLFKTFTDYLQFNNIIGVSNAGELNRAVEEGHSAQLINVAEALHTKYTTNIADEIARRYKKGGARIVLVAGPSSSGKTTLTKRLSVQLLADELIPQMISLDDYFVDRDKTPRDENGDYDFESLYALDLERFNADLTALLRGETVELPYFNFTTGTREFRGNKVTLGDRKVLLIEGIHALNPELTASVPRDQKFMIYASAMTTIALDDHNWVSTIDNRLLRRIVRDSKYRGMSAVETIRRWPSVRRGEDRWIYPFYSNADAMFNTSLLFELAAIKQNAEKALLSVPHNMPEYTVASRLLSFLSYFRALDAEAIPPTSLLREFVGGSSFRY